MSKTEKMYAITALSFMCALVSGILFYIMDLTDKFYISPSAAQSGGYNYFFCLVFFLVFFCLFFLIISIATSLVEIVCSMIKNVPIKTDIRLFLSALLSVFFAIVLEYLFCDMGGGDEFYTLVQVEVNNEKGYGYAKEYDYFSILSFFLFSFLVSFPFSLLLISVFDVIGKMFTELITRR